MSQQYFHYNNYVYDVNRGYQLAKSRHHSKRLHRNDMLRLYEACKRGQINVTSHWRNSNYVEPVLFAINPINNKYILIDGNHRLKKYVRHVRKGKGRGSMHGYFLTRGESERILRNNRSFYS